MSEKIWLNVHETAARIGKDEETVRRWARAKRYLPYSRIGGTFMFQAQDVDRFLTAARVEPEQAA
jgi:excisionase family DNA binding protein